MKIFLLTLFASLQVFASGRVNGSFFNSNSNVWWRTGSVLDLDFAGNRYYLNGISYTNITTFNTAAGATFSRASTATYYDSLGVLQTAAVDVPRRTYNSDTLAAKGLLIEEASTNLLLRSSEFDNAAWTKAPAVTVTPNAATAPDGTLSADLVTASGAGNSYFTQTGFASVANQSVTRSIYVKPGTTSNYIMEFHDANNCSMYCVAVFNLATKVATWVGVHTGQGELRIETLKNGWFRLSGTVLTSAAGLSNFTTYIATYGLGAGSMYVWGAQIELKAFPTSYIPTTAVAENRSNDNYQIPTSGWLDSTKGTFLSTNFSELNSNQVGFGRVIGGSASKAFISYRAAGSAGASIWNLTTSHSSITGSPAPNVTQSLNMATSWDQNSSTVSAVSGAGGTLRTGAYTGDLTSALIYPGGSNYNPLGAGLLRITYIPVKMPDSYLTTHAQ